MKRERNFKIFLLILVVIFCLIGTVSADNTLYVRSNATQPQTNNTPTTNVTQISTPANSAGNKLDYIKIGFWALVAVVLGAAILVGSLLIRKLRKQKNSLPNVK